VGILDDLQDAKDMEWLTVEHMDDQQINQIKETEEN
jgi:hypothetical protein